MSKELNRTIIKSSKISSKVLKKSKAAKKASDKKQNFLISSKTKMKTVSSFKY